MSRLQELIDELCPKGVEYKRLGDVATISRGGSFQKKDFCESGVPCIHYGQIYTRYGMFPTETFTYINSTVAEKQKFAEPGDVVMAVTSENIEDICKCIAWLGNEKVAISGHSAIIHHNLNPKYLVYYLHSAMFYQQKIKLAHGTKVMEVRPDDLKGISMPVPPLKVQKEIVNILDKYTVATEELKLKLEEEMEARQKQYEYYNKLLMTGENEVTVACLKDIAQSVTVGIATSATHAYADCGVIMFRNQNIKRNMLDDDDVVYITKEFADQFENKSLKEGDILVTRTGYPGQACLVPKEYEGAHTFTTLIVRINDKKTVSPEYVCRYINSTAGQEYVDKMKTGAAQQNFGAKALEMMPITMPNIDTQEVLCVKLKKLDEEYEYIKNTLVREIEARKKQYEYYRDKLLNFKELAND